MNGQSITVLGIHDGHNAGAAILRDGKVLAACSEERLTNIKNYCGAPIRSIEKVLDIVDISPADITIIAIASYMRLDDPLREERNILHVLAEYITPYVHNRWFIRSSIWLLHHFRQTGELFSCFERLGIRKKPIVFIEHHLTHAACAYYQRPWNDKTLVLTLDGMGDGISATVSIGKDLKMERLAETSFYDSIGNNLYSEITAYLGMKRWEHEYKVMGLAPYGRADGVIEKLRNVVRISPQKPLEFENISGHYLKRMQLVYRTLLAGERFDNIAAATQTYFEELVLQWVKNAIRETKIHKLVVAGGCFLNVKVNKLIRELPEVEDVFFYPVAEDGGSPVGAALEAYYRYCEQHRITPQRLPLQDLYFGQEFSNDEVQAFLRRVRLLKKARQVSPKEIAKLLASGNIIARFAAREEWGPRALGNRSILADPRNATTIRRINSVIKQRDFWMPFAPAILSQVQSQYLRNSRFSPYMIEAFDTKKKGEAALAAAIHPADSTTRPQTVNGWNPPFRAILQEFEKQTGVGALLNTSFNLHGYPICGTLETAYSTFQNSRLDGLLLNDWLILR